MQPICSLLFLSHNHHHFLFLFFFFIFLFFFSECKLTKKEQGSRVAGGDEGAGEDFLNFQVKNAGFYAFLLPKTTCDQKPGPGGLIDPLRLKM